MSAGRTHPWLMVLLGLASTASAAEVVMHDVSLSAVALPAAYDFTLSNGTTTSAGAGDMAWHGGLRMGYLNDLGGPDRQFAPVVGLEGLVASGSLSQGSVREQSLVGVGGLAWGATDHQTWLLLGTIGAGLAQVQLPDGVGATGLSLSGTSTTVSGRLGWRYDLNRRWLVGIDTEWLTQRARVSGDADLTLNTHGLAVGLVVVWRASFIPHVLE